MKKIIFWSLALFSLPVFVFARGYHRPDSKKHPIAISNPPPAPTPVTPPSGGAGAPVSSSGIQWGAYTGNTQSSFNSFAKSVGKTPEWQMVFNDFSFPTGYTGNLLIYPEAKTTNDSQILAGALDSQIKSFASAAAKYPYEVRVALNEEVNCATDAWSPTYKGNTTQSVIAAFQHEASLLKAGDPSIQIGYSVNNGSCYGAGNLTAYYPGSAYVDYVSLDGFSFANYPQTWDQVFDDAIKQLQPLGKPIWIDSEGTTSNKSKFISDTFAGMVKYNLTGFMYFNGTDGGNWLLDAPALATLNSLTQ